MDIKTIIWLFVLYIIFKIVEFFVCREAHCWYEKRNEQLEEARKTNQLLKEIRALLLQGNEVSGIVGNEIVDIKEGLSRAGMSDLPMKDDFSDLPDL